MTAPTNDEWAAALETLKRDKRGKPFQDALRRGAIPDHLREAFADALGPFFERRVGRPPERDARGFTRTQVRQANAYERCRSYERAGFSRDEAMDRAAADTGVLRTRMPEIRRGGIKPVMAVVKSRLRKV